MQVRKFGFFRRLSYLFAVFFALCILVTTAFFYWANKPVSLSKPTVEFTIAQGSSLGQIVSSIQQSGVEVADLPLKLLARYMGVTAKIKAGTYQLTSQISPRELLEKIYRGDVIQVEIVLPEGWTFRQIRVRLDAHSGLRHETRGMSDAEVLRVLAAPESVPEGLFFPDTYRVELGASDVTVLRAAYRAMQQHLGKAWNSRRAGLPLKSPYEALILASIVEKETGLEADRPMVASVFINRLRLNMLLQTDPTVIYGMGPAFDGNLRRKDLERDGPYNTYTRSGLTPTPISMPGKASIEAVLQPPESNMLYFVARGDGSSVFSATLEAHNRAVNRHQRSTH